MGGREVKEEEDELFPVRPVAISNGINDCVFSVFGRYLIKDQVVPEFSLSNRGTIATVKNFSIFRPPPSPPPPSLSPPQF